MIAVDRDGKFRLGNQLSSFDRALSEAQQKHEEADKRCAEAGARLMAALIDTLGPEVLTLANAMVYGKTQLIDRLVQIAELVNGECDVVQATIIDYGAEGRAVLILESRTDAVAVEIEVSPGANVVTQRHAEGAAEILSVALGFEVPVIQETGGG